MRRSVGVSEAGTEIEVEPSGRGKVMETDPGSNN